MLGSRGKTSLMFTWEGDTWWGEDGTSRRVPLEKLLGLLHDELGIDHLVSLGD